MIDSCKRSFLITGTRHTTTYLPVSTKNDYYTVKFESERKPTKELTSIDNNNIVHSINVVTIRGITTGYRAQVRYLIN